MVESIEVARMQFTELGIEPARLGEICRRHHVRRLELFGSFQRGDADAGSDLDLLVTFDPGVAIGLQFVTLRDDLIQLVGRPVDLLTRASVEQSPNKYFRRFALQDAHTVYERT